MTVTHTSLSLHQHPCLGLADGDVQTGPQGKGGLVSRLLCGRQRVRCGLSRRRQDPSLVECQLAATSDARRSSARDSGDRHQRALPRLGRSRQRCVRERRCSSLTDRTATRSNRAASTYSFLRSHCGHRLEDRRQGDQVRTADQRQHRRPADRRRRQDRLSHSRRYHPLLLHL